MPESDETKGLLHDAATEAKELKTVVRDLSTQFEVHTQTTKLLKKAVVLLSVLLALVLVGGGVAGVYFWKQNARMNAYLADGVKSREAIGRIDDCINPAGVCYQKSQAQTKDLLGRILDANHNGRVDIEEILDALRSR